jgi:hypothetical protein
MRFYTGMGEHLKIITRVSPCLPTCPSIPAAREPISVAISADLLRKRRVTMEDVMLAL